MKKWTALLLSALMVLTLLTGCGGASQSKYAADNGMPAQSPAEINYDTEAAGAFNSASSDVKADAGGEAASLPQNRKWVITVYLNAETEDLEVLLTQLDQQINQMQGYIENQEIYNGSAYSARRYRSADLTIRIPAADVDAFTQAVSGAANITSKQISREDITLNYTATDSKVTALKTEESRLLELMAKAETMSDLLEIEERLSQVRYDLELYTSRLRLYDNQVDYATIHLSVSQVQEYTPAPERTVGQRIQDGFRSSLKGVGEGAVNFVVWFLSNLPYLVVWAAVLAALWFVTRKPRARRKERKAAKKAAALESQEGKKETE